jgi:hypothetical protein
MAVPKRTPLFYEKIDEEKLESQKDSYPFSR